MESATQHLPSTAPLRARLCFVGRAFTRFFSHKKTYPLPADSHSGQHKALESANTPPQQPEVNQ